MSDSAPPKWSLAGFENVSEEIAKCLELKLSGTQVSVSQGALGAAHRFLEQATYGIEANEHRAKESDISLMDAMSALVAFTKIYCDELPAKYSAQVVSMSAVSEKLVLQKYVLEHLDTPEPLPDDCRQKFDEAHLFYIGAKQKASSASRVESFYRWATND